MSALFGDISRNGGGSGDVPATSATGVLVHMKLRFLGGRYQGRIMDLEADGFSIGRGSDNDLVLDEEGASRHHGRIYSIGGKWHVEDLDSTNGVRVNGERIEGTRELEPGDRVGISQHVLLFTDGSDIVDSELMVPPAAKRPARGGADPAPPEEPTMPAGDRRDVAVPAPFPWVRAVLLVCVAILLIGGVCRVAKRSPAGSPSQPTEDALSGDTDALGEDDVANLMAREEASGKEGEEVLAAPTEPLPPVSLSSLPEQGDGTRGGPEDVSVRGGGSAAGAALVVSDPPAATVLLNGDSRGTTPLALTALRAGRHRLTLRLAGYEDFVRQIDVPGLLPDPTAPYVLQQIPGSVRVTSDPSGAAVLAGTQVLGRTPLVVSGLDPGEHELRLASVGFEPRSVGVTVDGQKPEQVHVELVSVLGGLEIVTAPPGCRVYVDKHCKGTTVPAEGETGESAPLRIGGLREGEHALRVEHPTAGEKAGTARVSRDAWKQLSVRLVKPRGEDGAERRGAGKAQGAAGALFGTDGEGDGDTDAAAGDGGPAGEGEAEGPREYTPDALLRVLKMTSATELARQFTDVAVSIRGVPTAVSRDGPRWRVDFGPKIRCYFSRFDYDNAKAQLGVSRARDEDIVVTGTAEGYYITGLVIRDCELLRGVEGGNGEE